MTRFCDQKKNNFSALSLFCCFISLKTYLCTRFENHKGDIVIQSKILVEWVSGLNQRFAKSSYLETGTGGSNPSSTAYLYLLK